MNKLERIEEMEKQLTALRKEVEQDDKPKRVRVYIKEDARKLSAVYWSDLMDKLAGCVLDVRSVDNNGRIFAGGWNISKESYIVVEGSLDDLK